MSTAVLPIRTALVDKTGSLHAADLAQVAAALNTYLATDVGPAWGVKASVIVAPPNAGLEDAWPIYLEDGLDVAGALGYHVDEHGQPASYVDLVGSGDGWPATVAHELVEMVVDHTGNRLWTADAPASWHGDRRVRWLIEAADPCEAVSYPVAGVELSDFVLPTYYRSHGRAGRYSHTGAITQPRTVLDGGYVSWLEPSTGEWWQRFVNGGQAQDRNLGRAELSRTAPTLRAWVDLRTRELGRP